MAKVDYMKPLVPSVVLGVILALLLGFISAGLAAFFPMLFAAITVASVITFGLTTAVAIYAVALGRQFMPAITPYVSPFH